MTTGSGDQQHWTARKRLMLGSVAVLLAISPVLVWAQATSGSIIGTVTDSSGAVVPGAKVTVANVDQGVKTTTQTNESGNYTQTQLLPGHYSVRI